MIKALRIGTILGLLGLGLVPDASAAELPFCLVNPGVPDLEGFTHRVQIRLGGSFWYLLGPELQLPTTPDQAGQPQDLPGHCWKVGLPIGGKPRLIGKHFNTGPLGAGAPPRFWSSNAGSHQQLFWVDLVISRWSPRIALEKAADGYVHYHELIKVGEGCLHPRLVAWFRHSAIEKFSFDGGPPPVLPDGTLFRPRNVPHDVQPGIDHNFPPNYDIPYKPESQREGRDPFFLPVCGSGD
ncbi:MAG: hypothetical protein GY769_25690 [bacterium]|nr:hypothetical protein [bacterium]